MRSVSHLCQYQESILSGHTKGCNSVCQLIWVYGYIKLLIIFKPFYSCSLDGQTEILSLGKGPFREGALWADISYSWTLT